MSDFYVLCQDRKHATSTLDLLATSLGCPVEAFSNPTLTEEGQTLEFLRLWLAIEDGQDRAKVMAFLRGMTARTLAPSEPEANAMHKPMSENLGST